MVSHAGHGIWKCSCGEIIKQCRCFGLKQVYVVRNGCQSCQNREALIRQVDEEVSGE